PLTVVRRGLVDVEAVRGRLEVGGRGLDEGLRQGLVAGVVLLDVHVHVDGGQRRRVDGTGVPGGHRRHRFPSPGRASAGGSGMGWPTCWSLRPNSAPKPAAMDSARQPPSWKAVTTSSGCDHSASRSPPMPTAWPEISAASSEARKATSPATSSASPKLSTRRAHGTGSPRSAASENCLKNGTVSVIAVAATGITALTV